MALLEARDCALSFGGLRAVADFDLAVDAGQVVGLIGPNGAGKTTCFNLITGVYAPDAGSITFDGRSIAGLPAHRIVQRGIARTFQGIRLFGQMTVLENVLVGAPAARRGSIVGGVLRSAASERAHAALDAEALRILDRLGLAAHAGAPARSLPYGSQRRLEIARALATQPRILLLDEPAAGMNPQEKVALMDTIRWLRDELGLAVLVIEHDMKLVMGVCDRITVLDHGEVIAEGPPAAVRADPKVIAAYLGEEA